MISTHTSNPSNTPPIQHTTNPDSLYTPYLANPPRLTVHSIPCHVWAIRVPYTHANPVTSCQSHHWSKATLITVYCIWSYLDAAEQHNIVTPHSFFSATRLIHSKDESYTYYIQQAIQPVKQLQVHYKAQTHSHKDPSVNTPTVSNVPFSP